MVWRRRGRAKNHEEQRGGGAHDDHGKEEQDEPQENVGAAEVADGFLFHVPVLRSGEETFARPVLQQIAGAQNFFARCAVSSHASLAKRRAIQTSMTSMATPVMTK